MVCYAADLLPLIGDSSLRVRKNSRSTTMNFYIKRFNKAATQQDISMLSHQLIPRAVVMAPSNGEVYVFNSEGDSTIEEDRWANLKANAYYLGRKFINRNYGVPYHEDIADILIEEWNAHTYCTSHEIYFNGRKPSDPKPDLIFSTVYGGVTEVFPDNSALHMDENGSITSSTPPINNHVPSSL